MSSKPLVAVTGPGGRVGRAILPLWGDRYRLRLLDRRPPRWAPAGAEVIQGDIADLDALTEFCRGAGALVHLAAVAGEADFRSQLLPHNLAGAYHAFEAARRAGVPRVIYASSGQVGGGYPPTTRAEERATVEMPPRPITVYACTKLWGEALGLYYAQQHGLSVFCLRMGFCDALENVLGQPDADTWVSPRDLAEAIATCIEAPHDVDYLLSYATSDNAHARFDCSPLRALGWAPVDQIEEQ